ncbi:MAG: thiamine-binding protein [Clostridiales bacterium]|nr:thiamine-binding protein [Clostridiales bacterium]
MNQPEASVAIQVLPDVEGEEVIRVVDEVIAYIKAQGLPTYVGPFETTIEGDYDQLMDIVKECQLICIKAGAPSVMSYVKISYNPDAGVWTIDKKVTKHHS